MTNHKRHIAKTLGVAMLAAAWIIAGPDWLAKLGIQNSKAIDLLTLTPAVIVMFFIIKARPGFLACERRTFKKILNIK